jgi:hypothetical protein
LICFSSVVVGFLSRIKKEIDTMVKQDHLISSEQEIVFLPVCEDKTCYMIQITKINNLRAFKFYFPRKKTVLVFVRFDVLTAMKMSMFGLLGCNAL